MSALSTYTTMALGGIMLLSSSTIWAQSRGYTQPGMVVAGPSHQAPRDPAEDLLVAYRLRNEAEKAAARGNYNQALKKARQAEKMRAIIVRDHPNWKTNMMSYLREQSDGTNYDNTVMEEIERAAQKCNKKGGGSNDRDDDDGETSGEGYLNDRQFLDAVEVAVNSRKISTSLIQRKLSIGYGKAAKFIDIMEEMGVVGEANGQRPREVLLTPDEWREKLMRTQLEDY